MLCIHVELYHKQGSHSHGKFWKKGGHGKLWKIAKIQNFCQEKSHGKVMEISCPNPPNLFVLLSMWIYSHG